MQPFVPVSSVLLHLVECLYCIERVN
jgi:hypothetical protein